jgi:hypothetical protein
MVLTKQHASAYLEAIIRFTNVGYRRLTYIPHYIQRVYIMFYKPQMMRSQPLTTRFSNVY